MGIFDFLKTKKQENIEVLKFSNLKSWINNKKETNIKKEENFILYVKTHIDNLRDILKEKIIILKNINLNEKKIEDKVRLIIKDNLDRYIHQLERLNNNIESINDKEYETLIKKINFTFLDFEQRSKIHYEKATFIIGKELGEVKDSINNFFRLLEEKIKENKDFFETNKIHNLIELNIRELESLENIKKDFKKNINDIEDSIKVSENDLLKIEKDIKDIKKSTEYLKIIENRIKINNENYEIEKELYLLKDMIDFKELANLYHYDSKKMNLIKEFKDNFISSFKKDLGENLKELIIELKNKEKINNKIYEISKSFNELNMKNNILDNSYEDKIKNLEEQIKKINYNKEIMNNEINKLKKRNEKIKSEIEEIIKLLKENTKKINIDLVE